MQPKTVCDWLLWLCFAMQVSTTQGLSEITFGPYGFETQEALPCTQAEGCYKLEDLVLYSFRHAYDVQLESLHVKQVKKTAKAQLGDLLPHLNLSGMLNFSGAGPLDVLSSMVGFLFPNRWKAMKATQKLRDAERENLKVTLADRANTTVSLYYNIQMQIYQIRVLDYYIYTIRKIIDELKAQAEAKQRVLKPGDLGFLRVLLSQTASERAVIDSLSAYYPQLAQSVGLDLAPTWEDFPVEETPFQVLPKQQAQHADYWIKAKIRSPEIKSLSFQKEAAKEQIRATQLSFLDPEADPKLGLGYGFFKFVEIAKLQVKVIRVQTKQTYAKIFTNIASALNNYNDAVDQFPYLLDAREGLVETFAEVQRHINTPSEPLDVVKVTKALEYGLNIDLYICSSMFSFLTAKTNLERYSWEGPFYENLSKFIEEDEIFLKQGPLTRFQRGLLKVLPFLKKNTANQYQPLQSS